MCLHIIVESSDITSRRWWIASKISASGLIIAEGVRSDLLQSFTALSLSHQCWISPGCKPRYWTCLRLRNIPSSSLRYDDSEEMFPKRKQAVAFDSSVSAIIQAHAATSSLRYTEPSLPIVNVSVCGSLRVFSTTWPGGSVMPSSKVCIL